MNTKRTSTFLLLLVSVVLVITASIPARPVLAADVPLTIIITRLVQIGTDVDPGLTQGPVGDFYAGVTIDGTQLDNFDDRYDFGFELGTGYIFPFTLHPFWVFSRDVDDAAGTVNVEIEIWDNDDCDEPFCTDPGFLQNADDQVDARPGAGETLSLVIDLATGQWSGDVTWPQSCAQGTGGEAVRVCWEISTLSTSGDADGDGLLDGWEANGIDTDGNGTIDVDLPAFGADPLHKDLFLELDWMQGNAPSRAAIQAMKLAFANAPIDAGTNGSAFTDGVDANDNPDGLPGINLWVDTGSLSDANAAEDGFAVGTCGDGIDNGGDGPADAADPDCLVGDDLGGGNQVAASAVPDLDGSFYAIKNSNFAAERRFIFRYGLSAAPGFEDGSAAGNSCFDGVDNGGGDEDADGAAEVDGQDPDCWPWGGGWGEIGGNDFVEYNHDGGTIMHEFGHTLNLRHGGFENANCKPNYVSVMNYDNQFGINQAGGGTILDYSPPRFAGGRGAAPLPPLVENNLNENIILDATDANNMFVFKNGNGRAVQWALNQPVDWSGDGIPPGPGVAGVGLTVNIDTADNNGTPGDTSDDSPGACLNGVNSSSLAGSDDWRRISLPFRQFGDLADAAVNKFPDPEPTLGELLDLQEALNTTDLAIEKSAEPTPLSALPMLMRLRRYPYHTYLPAINNQAGPALSVTPISPLSPAAPTADPAIAGAEVVYTLDVSNAGPNPANEVQLVDMLPDGVTYVSDSVGCVEDPTGTLTCDTGPLPAFQSQQTTVTVLVDADLVYNAGGPTTITNTASVANLVGPDLNLVDNDTLLATSVIAAADLEILTFEAVDPPAQIIVGEPISLTLRQTFTNNGPSAPMDVVVNGTAAGPADTVVTPESTSVTEDALDLDEVRTLEQEVVVQCDGFSHHLFTFTTEIEPLHDEDVDPDLSNNEAEILLDIECVVPVAIEVKPRQINLNGKGVIPVLVLDNEPGEFELPLAFDASTIDPLSVRFGPYEAVWMDTGGAAEAHERGHGHGRGLMLHFTAVETGLAPGDEQACLKGSWADAEGELHTFFGCTEVQVRQ